MRTRHFRVATSIAAAGVVSSLYLTAPVTPASQLPDVDAVAAIAPDRYLAHVTYLAREEMKGRGNGTPELDEAAEYIASQFRAWGLTPAGEGGTFFQAFELTTGARFGPTNELSLNGLTLTIDRISCRSAFRTPQRSRDRWRSSGTGSRRLSWVMTTTGAST